MSERQEASKEVSALPWDNVPQMLACHQQWRHSKKKQGARADLRYRRLMSLTKIDLSEADLQGADLSGADLRNTDFWRANLSQANFSKANLHGTILREANLQGADLIGATGLLPGQLAGANVANAHLPADLRISEALENVKEISDSAHKVFIAMLVGCVYCWITLATTRDVQLLTNSVLSPLPIVQTPIPISYFFYVAPFILLCTYGYLLLYLQRLWEGLAALPAVFPDGRTLHQRASSWLLNGLVSIYMFQLRKQYPVFMHIQIGIAILLAWGIVPLTLGLFFVRYLPSHDYIGTIVQLACLGVALAWGWLCYMQASKTLQGDVVRVKWYRHGLVTCICATVICLGLSYTSVVIATTSGSSRDIPAFMDFIKGTANLIGADVSIKPVNWTGSKEEELLLVKGARLAKSKLRCVKARAAFLDKADLSDADLEGTNLYQARLQKANLQSANLAGANIAAADLRGANLSHANLEGAVLAGARLTGADVRNATLRNADVNMVDLQNAFLTKSILAGAQLIATNLAGAVLAGADLRGAYLEGASLKGANLMEADLSNVTHLTQEQVNVACVNEKTKLPGDLTKSALCPTK